MGNVCSKLLNIGGSYIPLRYDTGKNICMGRMLSLFISPHWFFQDPSKLEMDLPSWLVGQSINMVVGSYQLNCTQSLLYCCIPHQSMSNDSSYWHDVDMCWECVLYVFTPLSSSAPERSFNTWSYKRGCYNGMSKCQLVGRACYTPRCKLKDFHNINK